MKCEQQRVTITIDIERDLGVCITSNLTWKVYQVYQQAAKTNKVLGYSRRNTMIVTSTAPRRTLYLALVHSHYGYGSPIWAPQTIEHISLQERRDAQLNIF